MKCLLFLSTNGENVARTRERGQNKITLNVHNNCHELKHTFAVFCATGRQLCLSQSVPSHSTPLEFVALAGQHYQSSFCVLGLASPAKYCNQVDLSLDCLMAREKLV